MGRHSRCGHGATAGRRRTGRARKAREAWPPDAQTGAAALRAPMHLLYAPEALERTAGAWERGARRHESVRRPGFTCLTCWTGRHPPAAAPWPAAAVAAHGADRRIPNPSDPLFSSTVPPPFTPLHQKILLRSESKLVTFLVDDPKPYVHPRKRIPQIWCRSCKIAADPPKNAPGRNNRLRAHPRRGRKSSFATFTSSPCACENYLQAYTFGAGGLI